ncbi:MAG: hypothetical protein WDA16_00770 [Candidatus Thermoplasmatota archaeon]
MPAPLMRAAVLTLLLVLVAAPAVIAASPRAGDGLPPCPALRATALVNPAELVSGECPGIRPGAAISTPAGGCTMAWILRDSAGDLYGATAGHCGNVGDRVAVAGQNVGTFVYSVNQPIGEDFGVFSIDADRVGLVSPEMCAWGGATATWTGAGGAVAGVVRHFGFGIGTGTMPQTRARSGALDYASATTFAFAGAVAPGDSGSPARLGSGEALGVITDLLAPRVPGTGPLVPSDAVLLTQLAMGTRLDHGLAAASTATGISLSLVTGTPANEP